jgi:hypothetical protein
VFEGRAGQGCAMGWRIPLLVLNPSFAMEDAQSPKVGVPDWSRRVSCPRTDASIQSNRGPGPRGGNGRVGGQGC